MSDYTEHDRLHRQAMETASERLLAALWREHPRIMTRLRAPCRAAQGNHQPEHMSHDRLHSDRMEPRRRGALLDP
jgi:hypothetical protein